MNIAILGSGDVGKSLADGFLKHGYEVMLGTRTREKLAQWQNNKNVKLGDFADAARFGEIIVLAVKGTAALEALEMAGEKNLRGKTIIDVTNPIADKAPVNGVLQFFTSLQRSLMEELQATYSQAHFVKAFNSIGSAFMVNPVFEMKPTMFICGDNDTAKKKVINIVDQFGFEAEDMGNVEAARAIEPLCMLWCIPGLLRNDWVHAFRLMKK